MTEAPDASPAETCTFPPLNTKLTLTTEFRLMALTRASDSWF